MSRWSSWKRRFWIKPSEFYHWNNLKSKLTDYSETRADLIWITSVCNFLLSPSTTKDVTSSRLVVVDLRSTKPCWHGDIKEEHTCWNCRQFGDSSIVLNINHRTLFVEWNNKRIFPDSRKNRWWDRQMKKFKNGLTNSSGTKLKHTPKESNWPRRIGWCYSFLIT